MFKKFNAVQTTDTSNLVKKTDYNTKMNETEKKIITDHYHSNKYITTQEFNKLTAANFAWRLGQANSVSKDDTAALVQKTDFDDKKKIKKKTYRDWKENNWFKR